ncbi:hypothetical protein [Streptomyces tateyamensis]|uniref:hypothetical protein n=1 Tax=Streptomyces tateyamensis TaxID=565073 RepID=UPI0011B56FB3|nr:hypothetical protein [Streptomyces tateyamensis]
MIDIVAEISRLPNVRPLVGMEDAWEWSPAPGFVLLIALSSDRQHAFRLNTKHSYDLGLCRSILEFVRLHEDEVVGRLEPLLALPGFSWGGREFDVVGRIRPEAHNLFPDNLELNSLVFGVFPAYECEISGLETLDQAAERFNRMFKASDMNRKPSPYVLVKFDNPKTGAGTIGERQVFVRPDYLLHELKLLEGVEDAYIDLWNHRNEHWSIRWAGQWRIVGNGQEFQMAREGVEVWALSAIL